jgi:hypothetical protein
MDRLCEEQCSGNRASVSFRSVGVVFALLLVVVVGCGGKEESSPGETARSKPGEQPAQLSRQEIWLARAVDELGNIEDHDSRSSAAQYTGLMVAATGSHEQARQLVEKFTFGEQRDIALKAMAGVQSGTGDLEQALLTVNTITDNKAREFALVNVATNQARRGQIDQAIALMSKIKEPWRLDMVRESVAIAQAESGDLPAAKATAAKIGEDDFRRDAMKAIAKGKIDKAPDPETGGLGFLQANLHALLQFSQPGEWRKPAAAALIAAGQKNDKELDIQIGKTLEVVEKADEPAPAIARVVLCVALIAAERFDEARKMARRFLFAADGEVIGISGLFGKPVLAYLFTRLGMEKELDRIRTAKPRGMISNIRIMQAVGAAEADCKNWSGMEKRYKTLPPAERVDFACGVLAGLMENK